MEKAFQCKMCGNCCHGEGGITVQRDEMGRISSFLGLSTESFKSEYCVKKNGRFSASTGTDGFCIFYHKEKRCLIHPVKPRICSLWPFYAAIVKDEDTWKMAQGACPGINPDCSFDEFVKQSKE
ncbi:YkgJ family cysteine cluster protein [Thermodesulfobacteriota bacterium]